MCAITCTIHHVSILAIHVLLKPRHNLSNYVYQKSTAEHSYVRELSARRESKTLFIVSFEKKNSGTSRLEVISEMIKYRLCIDDCAMIFLCYFNCFRLYALLKKRQWGFLEYIDI